MDTVNATSIELLTTNELLDELEKRMTAFIIVHESIPMGTKELNDLIYTNLNFRNCSLAHALGLAKFAQIQLERDICGPN